MAEERLSTAARVVLGSAAYAVCLGSGAFYLAHPALRAAVDANSTTPREAHAVLAWVGAAFAGFLALHALAAWRARPAAADHGALQRRALPLLALPVVEALASPGIERDRPRQLFFLVAVVAAIAGASAYTWRTARPALLGGRAAALALAALWAGYAAFFSRLSIVNHHALNTRAVSLGFYDNIFYQSAHGHPLGSSFMKAGWHGSAHFDPILLLFAPLYRLAPRAETLLVLQSAWLGAAVVPIYLLSRAHRLGRGTGLALAALWALHPAVHGANLYEFHSLTLVAPLALWLLYALETGRLRAYFALLLPLLMVREDVPFLLACVALRALLDERPSWRRAGWITLAASAAWFVLVKRVFMTSPDVFMTGRDAYAYAFNYEALIPNHDGASGLLVSLLTSPGFVLRAMFTQAKVLFLLALFLPLAFLPFAARTGRIMLAWGLLFSLLSTRPAMHSIHAHYACYLLPVAFALAPAGLRRVADSARLAAAGVDAAPALRGHAPPRAHRLRRRAFAPPSPRERSVLRPAPHAALRGLGLRVGGPRQAAARLVRRPRAGGPRPPALALRAGGAPAPGIGDDARGRRLDHRPRRDRRRPAPLLPPHARARPGHGARLPPRRADHGAPRSHRPGHGRAPRRLSARPHAPPRGFIAARSAARRRAR
jgi:uncharacterized membrane protein